MKFERLLLILILSLCLIFVFLFAHVDRKLNKIDARFLQLHDNISRQIDLINCPDPIVVVFDPGYSATFKTMKEAYEAIEKYKIKYEVNHDKKLP